MVSARTGRQPRGIPLSTQLNLYTDKGPESKGPDPTAGLDPKVVAVYTKLVYHIPLSSI